MKKLPRGVVRAFTILAGLACAGYLFIQVRSHWIEIRALDWTSGVAVALLVCVLVQSASGALDGWCWAWLLRGLAVQADARRGISIFGVAQFAKYLPGNVGQHVGRVGFAHAEGWQTGRVVLSLLLENGFALGAGALVAGTGGLLAAVGGTWDGPRVLLIVAGICAGCVTGTLVLQRILLRPPARIKAWLALEQPLELRSGLLAGYFLSHVSSYVAMGVVLAVLLRGLTGSYPAGAWTLPVAVTIAWLAGRLIPGAPAGLGMREAALTSLLGPTLGTGVALSTALLWRLTAIIADVVLLLVGIALRKGGARAAPQ